MARRTSSNPFDQDNSPELDMSSLVDVAFLLLIYFLVSTSLTPEEADISLTLPGSQATNESRVKIDQMMIRIDEFSAVYVNQERVETDLTTRHLANLTDRLSRYAAAAKMSGNEALVIVDCDDGAREQRFIDVLNSITGVGIKNVSLAQ